MDPKLVVIVASTRPGRVGRAVADWFFAEAEDIGGFKVELADLKDVGLPVYDEPYHPRLSNYQHEHTKRWSAIVDAADAFVIVTPEYNFSTPPALLNAVDFIYNEWARKPAGFVSYGGVSGGLRGVQMTKQLLTAVKIMPLTEAVVIPTIGKHMAEGVFQPTEAHGQSAATMLAELRRWAVALRTMRNDA